MQTLRITAGLVLAQLAANAAAGPVLYDDRGVYESQGSIAEFQDFESFTPDDFTFPGDPFVDGSVTYTSAGLNLVVGADTFIGPVSNTLSVESFNTALTADIAGEFNMLAMDIAINPADGTNDATLTMFTNLSSYLFDLTLPEVQNDQLFFGLVLAAGEFFTGFGFSPTDFIHIDNVTLGNAVAVPEPPLLALLLVGAVSLAARRRARA